MLGRAGLVVVARVEKSVIESSKQESSPSGSLTRAGGLTILVRGDGDGDGVGVGVGVLSDTILINSCPFW